MWLQLAGQDEINIESICSGLRFLKDTSTPAVTNNYQDNTGSDGSIHNYTAYAKTTVQANFWLHFSDWYDFKLKCHEIYRVFNNRSRMRIRTDAEPATVKYVYPGVFDIAPLEDESHDALFTVPFDNPSGYKYSLANSDELMAYDTGVWQLYGQNIPNADDINYHFNSQNSIRVYNASDIVIDPYKQSHELKIIMKHFGGQFTLANNTTGTRWAYKGSMTKSDVLEVDGLNTFKNGNLDNNNTDFGYLTLAQGWNNISISGASDLDITFSFPFIYID